MTERKVLLNAIFVRAMNERAAAQTAAALRALGLTEMATSSAGAQDFAARRNLEALGDRFLRFDAFGTTHNSIPVKKDAQYRRQRPGCKS